MRIISEKAKVTTACAGMEGLDAELLVEEITANGIEEYFIHANAYEGNYYTVSKESFFDEDNDDNAVFLEEYDSLEAAKDSRYYKYYIIADRMLNDLAGVE